MGMLPRLPPGVGACAALLCASMAASGHGGSRGDVRVILDGVEPPQDGLRIQMFDDHLAPQVVLENGTGRMLEILDPDGRPFIRIGAAGVEADVASPEWYRTVSPGGAAAPSAARGGASHAAWRRVRNEPSWGWFDPRIDPSGLEVPHALGEKKQRAVISRWKIPARLGGEAITIGGHFRYEPPPPTAWIARLISPADIAPGVRVALSQGRPPALLLENLGDPPVTVLGGHGEPFLRIGRAGVEANLSSPTWQDQARYRGLDAGETAARAERWERISPAPRFSWLEPRIAARGAASGWTIPIRVGERPAQIAGETVPTSGR